MILPSHVKKTAIFLHEYTKKLGSLVHRYYYHPQ